MIKKAIDEKNVINPAHSCLCECFSDCRSSSVSLSQAVLDGVKALGGHSKGISQISVSALFTSTFCLFAFSRCLSVLSDYGLVTTPQLHYMVCCQNTQGKYGEPTVEGYYRKLSQAFSQLAKNVRILGLFWVCFLPPMLFVKHFYFHFLPGV